MRDGKCHHDRSPKSTISTVFTAEVEGWRFWYCYCTVCGNKTSPCLTVNEAVNRAMKDWWIRAVYA